MPACVYSTGTPRCGKAVAVRAEIQSELRIRIGMRVAPLQQRLGARRFFQIGIAITQDADIASAAAIEQHVDIDDRQRFDAAAESGFSHVVLRAQQIGHRGRRGEKRDGALGLGIDGALEGLRQRQQTRDAGRVIDCAIENIVPGPRRVDSQ